ncbi:MAG: hypothetical protein R3A52_06330 [Polyangiales bacterium]
MALPHLPCPVFTWASPRPRAPCALPLALAPASQPCSPSRSPHVAAYFVVAETTRAYPTRYPRCARCSTWSSPSSASARYFAAAARVLDVTDGSVVDPDVGGMSYDSGLRVIDLFGLGDVAVAHTHPVDEPGLREALFGERRPTFVHLHGAWYAAVMLERLEELDGLYLRLPGTIGGEHDDGSNYVRREALAAPWTEEAEAAPPLSRRGRPCASTASHRVSARRRPA